jgi:hypothetical protein
MKNPEGNTVAQVSQKAGSIGMDQPFMTPN